MKQISLHSILSWLDTNILFILACFLTIFIPVYPKLPLFDIIPGYIVRVRIEDFVVLITGIIWVVQLWRKKITWKTPLTWIIGAYAVVGILSTLSALFITDTVPVELIHAGKTALHFFRYMEYFFLFFLLIEAVRSKFNVQVFFVIIMVSVLAISIYGYGQRYLYWPVYSTMNREFSKGVTLYLTEHARVQSTFGGHYDLGAYLVLTLPIILSGIYAFKRFWQKALLTIIFLFGLWLLIETASRASFLGFIPGGLFIIGVYSWKRKGWWKRTLFFAKDSFLLGAVMLFLMLKFGDDIYERFLQIIRPYPAIMERYDYVSDQSKKISQAVFSDNAIGNLQNLLRATPPPKGIAAVTTETGETVASDQVMVSSDERPSTRPPDVFTDIPDKQMVATISATGEVTTTLEEKPRTYSECAQKYGLSACIRYDTLWPRAIAGFEKNPLLGSGYATLTKESEYQFTEAESTDNNFLRTLGETGALGFITFYGTVILAMRIAWKVLRSKVADEYAVIFAASFIAGSIGLLINAIYIDVFAASKVAFTYWTLCGVICGTAIYLERMKQPVLANISTETPAPIVHKKKFKLKK